MGFFAQLGKVAKTIGEASLAQSYRKDPLYSKFSKYEDYELRSICKLGDYGEMKLAEFILKERGCKL